MKDEIKEILDSLKGILNEPKGLDEMPNGNLYEYDRSYDLEQDEIKILLDYITNLQKENRILKENAEHNDKVVDNARWNEMIYKSRNEKAIEYIKDRLEEGCLDKLNYYDLHKIENILQGEDKDE